MPLVVSARSVSHGRRASEATSVGRSRLFSVTVVPHTLAVTNLGALDIGGRVNLEADLFAKYVERLVLREASGTIEPVPE